MRRRDEDEKKSRALHIQRRAQLPRTSVRVVPHFGLLWKPDGALKTLSNPLMYLSCCGLRASVSGTAQLQTCPSAGIQRTCHSFKYALRPAVGLPARGAFHVRNCTGETQQAETSPPASASVPSDRRALLAGGAVGAGALFAVLSRKQAVTFAALEKGAVDLDTALANGKPTIIEFYASW